MDTFNFNDFWDSVPPKFKALTDHITKQLNNDAKENLDPMKGWGGKLFWEFISVQRKNPKQQSEFKANIDKVAKVKYATLEAVQKQGIRPLRAKIALCYSASLHEDISFPQYLLLFYQYVKDSPSYHLNFDGFEEIFTSLEFKDHKKSGAIHKKKSDHTENDTDSYNPQPKLRDPIETTNIYHYAHKDKLKIYGRKEEQKKLKDFLKAKVKSNFLWYQIAGVAGQGKSRLAWELVLFARDNEVEKWRAGLLNNEDIENFQKNWATWQPDKPHLFIIDYVIGREEILKPLFQTLVKRNNFIHPVRILFVERQPYNTGGLVRSCDTQTNKSDLEISTETDRKAEWFIKLNETHDGNDTIINDKKFDTGVLELEALGEDELYSIIRIISEKEGKKLELQEFLIFDRLKKIDSKGRPLYAYFLGQVLADEPLKDQWSKEDLLTDVLNREYAKRWSPSLDGSAPTLSEDCPALRLGVIATITNGIDCKDAIDRELISQVDAQTKLQALAITHAPVRSGIFAPGNIIPPLQPDLLGEWLVITSFQECLDIEEVMEKAWLIAPNEVSITLKRISEDFPKHPVTRSILEFKPPDTVSIESLSRVAFSISANFIRNSETIPAGIIRSMEIMSSNVVDLGTLENHDAPNKIHQDCCGDPTMFYPEFSSLSATNPMILLGILYGFGKGVDRSLEKSAYWLEQAAKFGNVGAMMMMGNIYEHGEYFPKNVKIACYWYKQAANKGIDDAISRINFLLK